MNSRVGPSGHYLKSKAALTPCLAHSAGEGWGGGRIEQASPSWPCMLFPTSCNVLSTGAEEP